MKVLWLVLVIFLPIAAQAEKMYVTDKLYITLRTGKGNEFRIIRSLVSGTAVEIVEKDSATGYTKVKTASHKVGWVRSEYLLSIPPAKFLLEKNQTENSLIDDENKQLKQQLTTTQQDFDTLTINYTKLNKEFESISSIASRPQEIEQLNKTLARQNKQLEQKMLQMQVDSSAATMDTNRNWFITGAGVLVGGILFGLIIPRLHLRKRSDWS